MNVVCVYQKKTLLAVIERPEDKSNHEVVRQWLRINGYKDNLINLCEFSSSPVIPWTEQMSNHPEIKD